MTAPGTWTHRCGVGTIGGMSYGEPSSFLQARSGIDVITSDGERVGALERVLSHEATNMFDGIVIDIRLGPGGHRFVDAPEVDTFYERAVVLKIPKADVDALPKP